MGIIPAVGRLFVMGGVIGGVIVAALVAGLATTTAIALGVVLGGIVGLFGLARRPRPANLATVAVAAMPEASRAFGSTASPAHVEAMASHQAADLDPEAHLPRWRRPSLLEARRSDPTRRTAAARVPMRFTEVDEAADLRVVRYAVVPVLDRPDEVLGLQLSDLVSGDEVEVVGASGAFLQVACPNGDHGWVHRTTLGTRIAAVPEADPESTYAPEAEDALTALLTARGLI